MEDTNKLQEGVMEVTPPPFSERVVGVEAVAEAPALVDEIRQAVTDAVTEAYNRGREDTLKRLEELRQAASRASEALDVEEEEDCGFPRYARRSVWE